MERVVKKLGVMVLFPYKLNGDWVFDDARVGLYQDPFIAGMPAIIDRIVADAKIKNPDDGFKLVLSTSPLGDRNGPTYQYKLILACSSAKNSSDNLFLLPLGRPAGLPL
jgi:hypothetical protein